MSPFDRPKLIHPPTTLHPYKPPIKYPSYDPINNVMMNDKEELGLGLGGGDLTSLDDIFNIPSIALLNPEESYAYAIIVPKKKSSGISSAAISTVRSLGYIEVNWASSMGEHARTCSEEILIGKRTSYPINTNTGSSISQSPATSPTSGLHKSIDSVGLHGTGAPLETRNNTLFLDVVQSPSEGYVGQEFQITLRLTNYYSYPIMSQIKSLFEQQYTQLQSQLIIIGLSVINVQPLDSGESVEIILSVLPINGGVHSLNGLVAVNVITKSEFIYNNLCTLMIYDEILTSNRWVNE